MVHRLKFEKCSIINRKNVNNQSCPARDQGMWRDGHKRYVWQQVGWPSFKDAVGAGVCVRICFGSQVRQVNLQESLQFKCFFAAFLELNNTFIGRKHVQWIMHYILLSFNEVPLKVANLLRQGPNYHYQALPAGF